MAKIRAIDMFCGAGGSSWGAAAAGVSMVAGFDHWELAARVYAQNFPGARTYVDDIASLWPRLLIRDIGRVDLILASPECTNHSPAKGSAKKDEKSRRTAFEVVRFAKVFRPRWVVIENVLHMRSWFRYAEFLESLSKLGYHIQEEIINAAEFGVPQRRRRLFIICDLDQRPAPLKPQVQKYVPAEKIIERGNGWGFSPLRAPGRAASTLRRADRAVDELGKAEAFLMVYYGTDAAGGWQRLSEPLRTITTIDRFALVEPKGRGHRMRMLQPPELQAGMGIPPEFRITLGSRRDKVHLLGNAVCPPVITAIIRSLVSPAGRGTTEGSQ